MCEFRNSLIITKEMANRAHQIFLDKFTIEQDLVQIAKMHEYILDRDKNGTELSFI